MPHLSDDSRLADLMVAQWEARQRALEEQEAADRRSAEAKQTWLRDAEAPPPAITITYELGTNGAETAAAAAKALGDDWQIWDHEIIEAIARDAHVRDKIVEGLDDHVSSAITDFVRDLFGLRRMEPLGYQHHLARVLLSVAQQGKKIFVGRGANFLLPNALHVRVQACFDTRVHNVMAERKVQRAHARRLIHHSDHERAAFVESIAHHRLDEDGAYDLIVWTDRLSPEEAATSIVATARTLFAL